jgi:NAD(P)H dehydrogenase (quinone)
MSRILVTGASGDLGRKTLLHLLERRPARDLVGLVRDPAKATDLAARGIELRRGDYLEPASLAPAFAGIDRLMLTATHAFTDRNTAHANAIDAAVAAGVRHLVFMPILRKPRSSFTMKEITEEDIFTVRRIRASGLTYTLAKHPPFLDNLSFYVGKRAQDTGVRVPAGHGKFTAATRDDLGAAHAAILADAGHENKEYALTGGPAISFADVAAVLSEATGKPVPYVTISEEEFRAPLLAQGIPDFVATFALKWIEGMNHGEWAAESRDLETLIGHEPTSPTAYFRGPYLTGAP